MSVEKVAIVTEFVAHYRAKLFKELLNSDQHRYVLFGDLSDSAIRGIRLRIVDDPSRFTRIRAKLINGRYLFQPGIIPLALRHDIKAIIFTGDAQQITIWISAVLARLSGKRVLF